MCERYVIQLGIHGNLEQSGCVYVSRREVLGLLGLGSCTRRKLNRNHKFTVYPLGRILMFESLMTMIVDDSVRPDEGIQRWMGGRGFEVDAKLRLLVATWFWVRHGGVM